MVHNQLTYQIRSSGLGYVEDKAGGPLISWHYTELCVDRERKM